MFQWLSRLKISLSYSLLSPPGQDKKIWFCHAVAAPGYPAVKAQWCQGTAIWLQGKKSKMSHRQRLWFWLPWRTWCEAGTGTPWEHWTEKLTCTCFHYTNETTLTTEKNKSGCNDMLGCGQMSWSAFGSRLFPLGAQPCAADYSPAPQGCLERAHLWGEAKIWWQAGLFPWARGLYFWGPLEEVLAVMNGLGRLYKEEGGCANLVPCRWQQQQWEVFQWKWITWFSCMLLSCNSFECDFSKENLLHSSVFLNLLLTVRYCHPPLED